MNTNENNTQSNSGKGREFANYERVIVTGNWGHSDGKEITEEVATVHAYDAETGLYWVIFRSGHGNGNSWHKADKLAHIPAWIKDGAQVYSLTGWRTGAASLLTQGTEGTGLNFGFAGQLASYSKASISEYHIGDYGYFWSSTIDPDAAYESAFIRKITPAQPNKVQRVSTMTSYRYISVRYCRDAR